jgi:glutathione synthase/RimK-type ligase-like ATP-grasp enzyme
VTAEPQVLVISTAVDAGTDAVVDALHKSGASVFRLNTETFPYSNVACLETDSKHSSLSWLPRPGSIWYRRIRSASAPEGMLTAVHDYCCQESKAFVVGAVLAAGVPTMSDPQRIWAAENKLFQLRIAREAGLPIPETVVTNNPSRVRDAFKGWNERLVVKPLHSGYVNIDGDERAVFTSQVLDEHLPQMDSVQLCPSIYQRLVDKKFDVRVTFVGDDVFVAEIDSQSDPMAAIDWRRTVNPNLPHRDGALPPEIERSARRLMSALGLNFGALDFVVEQDGSYLFLEINPNGQWLWLEDFLGFPISERIAMWLMTHARSH